MKRRRQMIVNIDAGRWLGANALPRGEAFKRRGDDDVCVVRVRVCLCISVSELLCRNGGQTQPRV